MMKTGTIGKALAAALALCLLLAVLPALPASAAGGGETAYTAAIGEDQTRIVGDTATVSVTVDSETETVFNTLDVTVTYDTALLELATTDLDGFSVRAGDGSVRVVGYGADRPVGTGFDLEFRCLGTGRAEVRLTSARADASRHAVDSDTPEIKVTEDTAVISVEEPAPKFRSQSLTLSGQIGVNFYLELPEIEGVDYTESYMEFTVNGKGGITTRDGFDPECKNSSGTYYGFTCYVNSIQMADAIRATFHYGEGKTVSKDYSVARYIRFFEENSDRFPAKSVALIRAIADYGYYSQIYMSQVHGFGIGTDYAEMPMHFTNRFDYDSILDKVSACSFVKELDGSKVTKATYKLVLDSTTGIDVYLTVPAGTEFTATAKFNENVFRAEKQADGRYRVRITGISAHQLGNTITVTGNAGGAFTVKVSVLAYVRSVLKNSSDNAARDCMAALYRYYAAVIAYRAG